MARPKEYGDCDKLDKAVERYFRSITRERTVTEKHDTGKRDEMGHAIFEDVPVLNRMGHEIVVIEYVVPPTVHDLCDFLHIDERTWERYCDEEKHPEFCRTTTRARGRMRAWNEHELLTREGKDVRGIIFNLENNYGYKDRAQVEMTGGLERYLQQMNDDGAGQEF